MRPNLHTVDGDRNRGDGAARMADITLKRGRHATVTAFYGHTAVAADKPLCGQLLLGSQLRRGERCRLRGVNLHALAVQLPVVAGDGDDTVTLQDDAGSLIGVDGHLTGLQPLQTVTAVLRGNHDPVAGTPAQRQHNRHRAFWRYGGETILLEHLDAFQPFRGQPGHLRGLDASRGGDTGQHATKGQTYAAERL